MEQMYLPLSIVILIFAVGVFFVRFERRKPDAREIVTLAVLCAIAVLSRAAFAWLPNMKPMYGILMIIGGALGAEPGFLVGAITALASNMIFGQGMWTPWQMAAYGLAGVLGAVIVRGTGIRKKILAGSKKHTLIFAAVGAVLIFAVVGPLLDTGTLFMISSEITKERVLAVYAAGVPVNAAGAAATFVTILLLAKLFFEKLERLQKKYGILEGGR